MKLLEWALLPENIAIKTLKKISMRSEGKIVTVTSIINSLQLICDRKLLSLTGRLKKINILFRC